jgi:integrase
MVLGVTLLPEPTRDALRALADMLHPSSLTQDVRRTRTDHWKALLAAWNRSAADWNHLRRALSAALTCAFGYHEHPTRRKLMKRLPLRPEPSRVSAVDFETFQRILAFVPAMYRPVFRTLLQTGLRRGEFCRLRPSHLNQRARIVNVPGTKTDESARPIMVHDDFWPDLLAAVPCPVGESRLYAIWQAACTAAGVTDARPHDLRHSFGQWSLESGVQDSEVQEALRQKSSNITKNYRRMKQTEAASTGLAEVIRRKRADDATPTLQGDNLPESLSDKEKVPQSD